MQPIRQEFLDGRDIAEAELPQSAAETLRAIMAIHAPPGEGYESGLCPVCITERDGYPEQWESDRYPCETLRLLLVLLKGLD